MAIGLVAFKTVEWAVLGPYRVLRTYLGLGERRQREAAGGEAEAEPGADGDGPGE